MTSPRCSCFAFDSRVLTSTFVIWIRISGGRAGGGMVKNNFLMGAVAENHDDWRAHQNLNVCPGRPRTRVVQVKPNHIIEFHATAAANLPESSDSRLGLQQPPAVPNVVSFDLIRNRRTWPD